jgi:rhodanese-related sulfurtransferase
MRLILSLVFASILTLAITVPAFAMEPEEVPKISVIELLNKLESNSNIVVIDTRVRGTYLFSNLKIKGAMDIPFLETASHISDLPFGAEIVTYCT